MKKLVIIFICCAHFAPILSAQNDAPKDTPQYDDPFKTAQQMQGQLMQQLQKMFGIQGNMEPNDSTQNFGFQQFRLPLGASDSTNAQFFSFPFGNNGWQLLTPEGDSTSAEGMRQMQERMQQMMPNYDPKSGFGSLFKDFDNLFQGRMPFNTDPSVVPPMDRQKPKSNKKYETERL